MVHIRPVLLMDENKVRKSSFLKQKIIYKKKQYVINAIYFTQKISEMMYRK